MRVKAGEYQKEIPERFKRAVELLTLSDWEKPEKVRLTPLERFRFAEAAWRVEQSPEIKRYLDGCKPEQIIVQVNRTCDRRATVRYTEKDGVHAQAIVPNWVWRACPDDLMSTQNMDFIV